MMGMSDGNLGKSNETSNSIKKGNKREMSTLSRSLLVSEKGFYLKELVGVIPARVRNKMVCAQQPLSVNHQYKVS
jgi:hypothetical protein